MADNDKLVQDFATVYGTIFSLSTTLEYLVCIQALMAERKANYARNKAIEAEKACQVVHDVLYREMTKRLSPEEKAISEAAIDHHKKLVYEFFLLDRHEQVRVEKLMDKIRKERK